MNLLTAHGIAVEAVEASGLRDEGWTFDWSNDKTAFGKCNYTRKTIFLSTHLTPLVDERQVRLTIIHEIAHALAGHAAGHGPKWRRICLALGGDGKTCGHLDKETQTVLAKAAKYTGTCGKGCEGPKHRRPSQRMICRKHRETMVWRQNY